MQPEALADLRTTSGDEEGEGVEDNTTDGDDTDGENKSPETDYTKATDKSFIEGSAADNVQRRIHDDGKEEREVSDKNDESIGLS